MRGTRLSLSEYTRAVDAGWPDDDIGRAIIHDLPRRFHALPPAAQKRVLSEAPPLTNTRWDALLAATAEHIARLHGHPVPDWVDEAPRFLDPPWVLSNVRRIRIDSILYAPAAFIRHGALPDPKDLDARGGEKHEWLP